MTSAALLRFGRDYAAHRAAEGRAHAGEELFSLPYLRTGPLAAQWAVRARSFEALMAQVVRPLSARLGRPLQVADLGAGNGWLSWRLAEEGHSAAAVDIRTDEVDGLGAAQAFVRRAPGRIRCVAAAFDATPLPSAGADLAVFNASLHYALDLAAALAEAARIVRPSGQIVILDSPVYRREADGVAMAAEKRAEGAQRFGDRAEALLALPFIEFLTPDRLAAASAALGLQWRRTRVLYPLWYELRPFSAALRGARRPSRFDLWTSVRP